MLPSVFRRSLTAPFLPRAATRTFSSAASSVALRAFGRAGPPLRRSDATRVVLAVTDAFGNFRPFATGAIQLSIVGPGEIVGENPFSLSGGAGAVWVKAKEAAICWEWAKNQDSW